MRARDPDSALAAAAARERRIARAGAVLWPSFLVAALVNAIVFSLIDPASLHGFAHQPLGWSDLSVYTLGFFLFWAAGAVACAISQWLLREPPR